MYLSKFSTLFVDLRLVVSIQTNHTCHITSTELRDYFFTYMFFSSLSQVDSSFMGASDISCLEMYRTSVRLACLTKVRC